MSNHIAFKNLDYLDKIKLISKLSCEYLNMEAIFSDETPSFVSPSSPSQGDNVFVKLRASINNVDEAYLCIANKQIKMEKLMNENYVLFEFFTCCIEKIKENLSYHFLIVKNGRKYYYNKFGVSNVVNELYNFKIIPNFKTPDWAKGAVMYQIFVDRFYNGDTSNDVCMNEYAYLGQSARPAFKWDEPLQKLDVCNFYGGDLQGVIDKIPYLKDLGVDVIYFCPIFVSPSNHKYDIQDYEHIDPHYGVIAEDGGESLHFENFSNKYATKYIKRTTTQENLEKSDMLFSSLVDIAHENGMKVIVDGVFNHCGAFNKWMDKEHFYSDHGYHNGAFIDENSPYRSYFKWGENNTYDSWWGFDNHPKLFYENSKELYNYIMDIGKRWISPPFNADGWRFDVAADLGYSTEFNHKFWKEFRKNIKETKEDTIILAEHYGDPSDWLNGDEWDTIMNYDAFMEPITWFLTGMEKHSEEFKEDMLCNYAVFESTMRYQMSRFNAESLYVSMNMLSNHDHSRFLTRTNMTAGRLHTKGAKAASVGINKSIFMEAVIFQMTWPGAPTVYYGDEVSVTGWTDPDNRRTYPWGNEDNSMLEFHKEAIKIHKKYEVFSLGSLEFLYGDYGILCYGRFLGDQKAVVILNNNKEEQEISVPVWRLGCVPNSFATRIIQTCHSSFDLHEEKIFVENGKITIKVPGQSASIYV